MRRFGVSQQTAFSEQWPQFRPRKICVLPFQTTNKIKRVLHKNNHACSFGYVEAGWSSPTHCFWSLRIHRMIRMLPLNHRFQMYCAPDCKVIWIWNLEWLDPISPSALGSLLPNIRFHKEGWTETRPEWKSKSLKSKTLPSTTLTGQRAGQKENSEYGLRNTFN